jgi:hypothetical protein
METVLTCKVGAISVFSNAGSSNIVHLNIYKTFFEVEFFVQYTLRHTTFWLEVVKRKIPGPRRESNPRTPIVQPVAQRYTD